MRRWLLCLLATLLLGLGGTAFGDEGADSALVHALFDEARQLMDAGSYSEACPKLEQALHIDEGAVGVKFNLASCYEHVGRTASAWALYLDVAQAEKLAGHADRERAARDAAESVSATVPRLTLRSRVAGVRVDKDGEPVAGALLNTALPVDPGEHTIAASSPGSVPWKRTVRLEPGDAISLDIPDLAPLPREPVRIVPATPRTVRPLRVAAVVTGGLGIVALGVGAAFAAISMSEYSESNDKYCDAVANTCTDPRGIKLRDDAFTHGDIGTVGLAVGAGLLVAGAVLWLLPDTRGRASLSGRGISFEAEW